MKYLVSTAIVLKKTIINNNQFQKETNKTFDNISLFLLNNLNKITNNVRSKCDLFKIKKILITKKVTYNSLDFYELNFVQPGDTIFQAECEFDRKKNEFQLKDSLV